MQTSAILSTHHIVKTHHLSTCSILDLGRGVADGTIGVPLNVVAGTLSDEEWLGTTLILVAVDAFLNGKVEDLAFGNCLASCSGALAFIIARGGTARTYAWSCRRKQGRQ